MPVGIRNTCERLIFTTGDITSPTTSPAGGDASARSHAIDNVKNIILRSHGCRLVTVVSTHLRGEGVTLQINFIPEIQLCYMRQDVHQVVKNGTFNARTMSLNRKLYVPQLKILLNSSDPRSLLLCTGYCPRTFTNCN